MDSWYKIKSDMTDTHKKYMKSLKNVYEGSKKDYEKQVSTVKDKLDTGVKNLQRHFKEKKNLLDKIDELKATAIEIEDTNELIVKTAVKREEKSKEVEEATLKAKKELSDRQKAFVLTEKAKTDSFKSREKEIITKKEEIIKSMLAFETSKAEFNKRIAVNDAILKSTEKERALKEKQEDKNEATLELIRRDREVTKDMLAQAIDTFTDAEKKGLQVEKKEVILDKREIEQDKRDKSLNEGQIDLEYEIIEFEKQKRRMPKIEEIKRTRKK